MKKIIFISMLIVCFASQAQDKPKVDEMHLKKWEFLVRRCQLTPAEIDSVKPIFMKYENSLWQLMENNKDVFNKKPKDNMSEEEYAKLNDKMMDWETKKAQLYRNYYKKLKVQLSAKTIFKYFDAERAFRQELIKDWKKDNDNKDGAPKKPNDFRPEMRPPEKKPEHR